MSRRRCWCVAGVFQKKLLEGVGEDLHRRLLYLDSDLLAIDKPPGLAVQGGDNIAVSIDTLAASELRFNAADRPR